MFKPRHDKFSNKHKGSGGFSGFGNFHQGRDKGDRDFGGGGGWDREERVTYDAVCDQCGRACKVPFKPTGSRPVLCNSCFKKDGDSGPKHYGGKGRERPSFRREEREYRKSPDQRMDLDRLEKQIRSINQKLDLLIESLAPSKPPKKKKGGKKAMEVVHEEDDDDDDEEEFDDDADADEDLDDDDLDADEDDDDDDTAEDSDSDKVEEE